MLELKGIIFWNNFHFTNVIIDDTGVMWAHDGITTGRGCLRLSNVSLYTPASRFNIKGVSVLAIYRLKMTEMA